MNLPCLREHRLVDGVTILALSTVDIPLAVAAREGLTGLPWAVPRFRRSRHRPPRSRQRRPEPVPASLPPELTPFRYRAGDGPGAPVETLHGVVVAEQLSALLDFAERRYEPLPGSTRGLDLRVAELRRGAVSRERFLAEVEALLAQAGERYRPWTEPEAPESPLLRGVPRDLGDTELWDARRVVVASPRHTSVWSATAPLTLRHSGVDLPRRVFFVRHGDRPAACWDGQRFRLVRALHEVPDAILERLERLGCADGVPAGELVPLPDLVPRFLLRVPAAAEVPARGRRPGAPPARPAFLVDSRRALPLHRGQALPVIADPAVALEVLRRRSAHGVYLPGLPPAPLEDVALPSGDRPVWLVGCSLG